MFDELHDPQPPRPTGEHFDAVTARARQIRFRRWATATTAVVGVLAVSFGAVIAGDDGDSIRVETPTTTVPPPTTTEPPTTPPETAPGTTDATDAPDTTPPTTASPETTPPPDDGDRVPEPAPLAVSHDDLPPVADLTPFADVQVPLDQFERPRVAVGDDEVVVVRGAGSDITARIVDRSTGAQRDLQLDVNPYALVMGPGDVVYGLVQHEDDPQMSSMRAIRLTGDQAGSVVATGDPVDSNRYTHLLAGWFGHGPDGIIDRQSGETLIGYVDADEQPVTPSREYQIFTIDDSDTISRDGSAAWPLEIDRHPEYPGLFDQQPVPAPSRAGGVYWTWLGPAEDPSQDTPDPTMPVIVEVYDDGTGWWWQIPDGWDVVASDVGGTLLGRRTDAGMELAWFDPLGVGTEPRPEDPPTPTPDPEPDPIALGAIDADGNAVVIGTDGSPEVVWEAMEPPEEGEGTYPTMVIPDDDAGPLLVAFCCEPVPGDVYRIDPDAPDGRAAVAVGESPARSDGGRLATWHAVITPPEIGILEGASGAPTLISVEDAPDFATADLMWVSEEQLVVLAGEGIEGDNARLLSIDVPSQTVSDPIDIGERASFAGVGADGEILVHLTGTANVIAYDPDTLEQIETSAELPGPAQSAWFADGNVAWVATDGTLASDGTVVDGSYQWVRG